MKKNRYALVFVIVLICASFCACRKTDNIETTEMATETTVETEVYEIETTYPEETVPTTEATEETTPKEIENTTVPAESTSEVTQPVETQPVETVPAITEAIENTQPEAIETLPPYMTDLG